MINPFGTPIPLALRRVTVSKLCVFCMRDDSSEQLQTCLTEACGEVLHNTCGKLSGTSKRLCHMCLSGGARKVGNTLVSYKDSNQPSEHIKEKSGWLDALQSWTAMLRDFITRFNLSFSIRDSSGYP